MFAWGIIILLGLCVIIASAALYRLGEIHHAVTIMQLEMGLNTKAIDTNTSAIERVTASNDYKSRAIDRATSIVAVKAAEEAAKEARRSRPESKP